MSAGRLWIIILALASVVVVVLGWVIGVKPQVDSIVAAQQLRDQVIQENIQHGADLVGLKQQFSEIDVLRRELSQLRETVPEGWDQASVVKTVRETADAIGVKIQSIEWLDAVYYAPPSSGGAAVPTPEPTSDTEAEGPDATSGAVPIADATAGVVTVDSADASALTNTLVAVPVTITLNTSYENLLTFISMLRDSDRLLLVTGAFLDPAGAGGVSFITGLVYVLPGPTE